MWKNWRRGRWSERLGVCKLILVWECSVGAGFLVCSVRFFAGISLHGVELGGAETVVGAGIVQEPAFDRG